MSVPGIGLEEQFSQQGGGGLQDFLPLQCVGVVQKAGREAHALGLPLLADHRLNGPAVELVQGGGQGFHIRVDRRPPAEHRGDQRVGPGGPTVQGGHQGEGQIGALKLVGMHCSQPYPGKKLPARNLRHIFGSFL